MSNNQQDIDIKEFKKSFFVKHNVQVFVFTPSEEEYLIPLDVILECAHKAFVTNHPEFKWITSMTSRIRHREYQIYYQTASHIAWYSGHNKTSISKSVNRTHASIINAIKMVDNAYFTKNKAVLTAYKQILKLIIENVGTIPEDIKRKIDSQPNAHLVWDEEQNLITSS
tara:strand:- start:45 stop:551 length:507 start_codon:yes stop_codon:yes gene_type:complete